MRYIVSRVDVNSLDHNGQTALTYAVGNNHSDCVGILLASGANPNVVESRGNTAMHNCASSRSSEQIWKLLVEHGGDAHVMNDDRETAIDLLRAMGRSGWDE